MLLPFGRIAWRETKGDAKENEGPAAAQAVPRSGTSKMLPTGKHYFFRKGTGMPTVEEDIQHLIRIVEKDREIKNRRKLIDGVPARVKAIDKELARMDEDLAATSSALEKLEREKSQIAKLIESQKAELERKKAEQRQVRTNKEFQALLSEMQYIHSQIDKEEERILVILDEAEERKKTVKAIADRIDRQKNALVEERDALLRRQKESEEALRVLEDEKLRILPHLSNEVRRLYERILNAKGDSGAANIVMDICQGCYSRVPPQTAHEVRRNNEIMTCETCGRILVFFEEKA